MLNVASVTLVRVPFSWLALDSYGEVKGQCNLLFQVFTTHNPHLISSNYCCLVENFCHDVLGEHHQPKASFGDILGTAKHFDVPGVVN